MLEGVEVEECCDSLEELLRMSAAASLEEGTFGLAMLK